MESDQEGQAMTKYTREDLRRLQSEPLEDKIQISIAKIGEWYLWCKNQCHVSFSGGKDSTVLADLCAQWCKAIDQTLHLVFVDTGLEYPEIKHHVKTFAQWLREKHEIEVNLEILRPKMRFDEVIRAYGYPIISKEVAHALYYAGRKSKWAADLLAGVDKYGIENEYRLKRYAKWNHLLNVDFLIGSRCCNIMKERPLASISSYPIIGTMAQESLRRETSWLKTGCNAFNESRPISKPLSFWTEQDVLSYVQRYDIPIASVYGDVIFEDDPEQIRIEGSCGHLCTTGCKRTGCIFCGFGAHLERGETRYQRLARTHPKQYAYCIGGGEYNESGMWVPNKKGLGMGHVFDELNRIYGDDFIRYKPEKEQPNEK